MALAALVGGLALLAGACGGGGAPTGVAHLGNHTSTTATLPPAAAGTGLAVKRSTGLAFSQCMRSHGVANFPDPGNSGGISISSSSGINIGSPTFRAAQKACRKLLPNGGQPTPAQEQAAMANALKFSQCMRSHGIADFPDPQTGQSGGVAIKIHARAGGDLNPHNPQFQAAQAACQKILGGPKGPGKFTSGPVGQQAG
jgi:hypothetical protein